MKIEFDFIRWDETSNPFEKERDWASAQTLQKDPPALAFESKELLEEFSLAFQKEFLDSNESQPTLFSNSLERAENSLWKSRMKTLESQCKENSKTFTLQRFPAFTFQQAVDIGLTILKRSNSHKQTQTSVSVTCLHHPRFQRPFTAIGEKVFLFVDKIEMLDVFRAARLVHELAHIFEAMRTGWKCFQLQSFKEIEEPALKLERDFLVFVQKQFRQTQIDSALENWQGSALRYVWYETMQASNVDIGYLEILNEIDP